MLASEAAAMFQGHIGLVFFSVVPVFVEGLRFEDEAVYNEQRDFISVLGDVDGFTGDDENQLQKTCDDTCPELGTASCKEILQMWPNVDIGVSDSTQFEEAISLANQKCSGQCHCTPQDFRGGDSAASVLLRTAEVADIVPPHGTHGPLHVPPRNAHAGSSTQPTENNIQPSSLRDRRNEGTSTTTKQPRRSPSSAGPSGTSKQPLPTNAGHTGASSVGVTTVPARSAQNHHPPHPARGITNSRHSGGASQGTPNRGSGTPRVLHAPERNILPGTPPPPTGSPVALDLAPVSLPPGGNPQTRPEHGNWGPIVPNSPPASPVGLAITNTHAPSLSPVAPNGPGSPVGSATPNSLGPSAGPVAPNGLGAPGGPDGPGNTPVPGPSHDGCSPPVPGPPNSLGPPQGGSAQPNSLGPPNSPGPPPGESGPSNSLGLSPEGPNVAGPGGLEPPSSPGPPLGSPDPLPEAVDAVPLPPVGSVDGPLPGPEGSVNAPSSPLPSDVPGGNPQASPQHDNGPTGPGDGSSPLGPPQVGIVPNIFPPVRSSTSSPPAPAPASAPLNDNPNVVLPCLEPLASPPCDSSPSAVPWPEDTAALGAPRAWTVKFTTKPPPAGSSAPADLGYSAPSGGLHGPLGPVTPPPHLQGGDHGPPHPPGGDNGPPDRPGGNFGALPPPGGNSGPPLARGGDNGPPPPPGGDNGPPPPLAGDNGPPPPPCDNSGPPPPPSGNNGPPPSSGGNSGPPLPTGADNGPPPLAGGGNGPPPSTGGDTGPPPPPAGGGTGPPRPPRGDSGPPPPPGGDSGPSGSEPSGGGLSPNASPLEDSEESDAPSITLAGNIGLPSPPHNLGPPPPHGNGAGPPRPPPPGTSCRPQGANSGSTSTSGSLGSPSSPHGSGPGTNSHSGHPGTPNAPQRFPGGSANHPVLGSSAGPGGQGGSGHPEASRSSGGPGGSGNSQPPRSSGGPGSPRGSRPPQGPGTSGNHLALSTTSSAHAPAETSHSGTVHSQPCPPGHPCSGNSPSASPSGPRQGSAPSPSHGGGSTGCAVRLARLISTRAILRQHCGVSQRPDLLESSWSSDPFDVNLNVTAIKDAIASLDVTVDLVSGIAGHDGGASNGQSGTMLQDGEGSLESAKTVAKNTGGLCESAGETLSNFETSLFQECGPLPQAEDLRPD
eukprot:TRINITY_DN3136_c0_g1_i1.p1 TRINITY_DN3136_c0_g1~~TRINITY_DN3136_c0_g1_i1.p1  ORF type:complete len:1201 (-),score=93.94 TRINITY_DN3136_c0_g1_i1:115-3600(-)